MPRARGGAMERGSASSFVMGVALGGAMMFAGCQSKPPVQNDDEPIVTPSGPVPAIGEVVAKYNARVARLEAVESPVELVVTGQDENGKATKEQGEGNLKMVRPRKIALRIDKVGQTFFWLGSSETKYWWCDLRGEEKVALVGTHEKATPEVAARFGLPVHPVDLLDLAGVAPLEVGSDATIRWANDAKHVLIEMKGRWGSTRLRINPANGEATRVEMLDGAGNLVVRSRLEKYVMVPVRGDAASNSSMATRLYAEIPSAKATVELVIHTPVNNGAERIKAANFEYEDLKSRLGIGREIDLDTVGAGEAARPQPAKVDAR